MGSLISIVPVADSTKVEVANIVTGYFTHDLTILFDLSPDVVLLLEHVGSVVVVCFDSVLHVGKDDSFLQLVAKGAHKETVDLVLGVIVRDDAAIFKNNFSAAQVINCCRLHSCSDRPLHVPRNLVVLVVHTETGDRWVV